MSDEPGDELEGDWHELALLSCMQVADRMLAAGWELRGPGYWSLRVGELELALEPLTFGRWDLALYRERQLLLPVKLRVTLA